MNLRFKRFINILAGAAVMLLSSCTTPAAYDGQATDILAREGIALYAAIVNDTALGDEGYRLNLEGDRASVEANSDNGILYGAMHALRLRKSGFSGDTVLTEKPYYSLRILNHWDNLDATVERGYAGRSLWKWDELPDSISPRYREYAERCALVGINGTVLNNVNASSKILSAEYLQKVAAIADVLRPYGIKTYLSANFAAPMQLDSLQTADPLDPEVAQWWKEKADEIYSLIPDFGGFLVKANSEGQPGPCDFNRSHAEGANMMARALKPHGGIVMWRAFVYSPTDADRVKQAYLEFNPLDGQFDDNVIVQIKNGPLDFQPREPHSPLFDAMPQTQQMAELQITQEYLGHANHLAYLAPMWEEFFDAVPPSRLKGVAGVANVGDSECMAGNPMADANWYAFGRLAWNPELSSQEIVKEWLPMKVYKSAETPDSVRNSLERMMLGSREAVVDYMMPLGLHHIFAFGHHYGPEPWCEVPGAREDWLPRYYHRADTQGLGFERGPEGSDAASQYREPFKSQYASLDSCPENLLLWFHHVPWSHKMKSGHTLWDELCLSYERGVREAEKMQKTWADAKPYINENLSDDVTKRLDTQVKDARWWKDGCLLYFQQFSKMPFPAEVSAPVHKLDDMKKVHLGISNFESPSAQLLDSVR